MSEHDAVVRMLIEERIAINGLDSRLYKVGEIVHLPQALAHALIRDHIATGDLHSGEKKPDPKEAPPLPELHQQKRQYDGFTDVGDPVPEAHPKVDPKNDPKKK